MVDVPVPGAQYFIDSGGGIVPVAPEDVSSAALRGWVPASPEQVKDLELQQKFGQGLDPYKAAAAAAASTATFGLSDVALTQSGLVDPETLKGLEEANPTASLAGGAAGIAVPLVASALTGGATAPGAAAQAVKVASRLAPPTVLAKGTAAVAKGVEALTGVTEASSTAAKIAARAAGLGVGSAIEGAAYGAGHVVHEAALGDPNLTAQSALAEIGLTAILGGGLGAGLGIAETAVPAAITKAKDAIANVFGKAKSATESFYAGAEGLHGVPRATADVILEHKLELSQLEKVAPGITETISHAAPDVASTVAKHGDTLSALDAQFPGLAKTLSSTRPDTLKILLERAGDVAAMERELPGLIRSVSAAEPTTATELLDNWQKIVRDPKVRARLATTVRQGGERVIGSIDGMFKKAYGEMMHGGAGTLLADANGIAIGEAYGRFMGQVGAAVETMQARPSLFDPYYPAKLLQLLEDAVKDMGKVAEPATAFQHLTRLRQGLGDMVSWGKEGVIGPAERDAQRLVKEIYRELSATLRDKEIFGLAGALKAELDDAFAGWKRIITRKPGAMLGKSEKGTSNFNFLFMVGGQLSPQKMNQWFNNIANDTGALKSAAWSEMMDAAKRAVDAVENLHRAAPVTKFERAAVDDLINKSAQVTADAQQRFAITNLAYDLDPTKMKGRSAGYAAAPPATPAVAVAADQVGQAATVAGSVAQFLGATVGSTVKVVVRGAEGVAQAAHFHRGVAILAALERVGQRVSSAIDTGVGTLVRGGARASSVGRAEVNAGIARAFGMSPEDAAKAHAKHVAQIGRMSDPEIAHRTLVGANGEIDAHAPDTSQAMTLTMARAVAFLQGKVPQPPQQGPLAGEWQPSRADVARYARYWEAVNNPLVVLKQAAAGTLTPEAVEAVQVVYPELLAKVRQQLLQKLTSVRGPIAYQQRLMVSMVLGFDVDGSFSPSALAANTVAFAGAAQAAAGPGGPIKPTAAGASHISVARRSLTPGQSSSQRHN